MGKTTDSTSYEEVAEKQEADKRYNEAIPSFPISEGLPVKEKKDAWFLRLRRFLFGK